VLYYGTTATKKTLLTLTSSRKLRNFRNKRKKNRKNALSICDFSRSAKFLLNFKNKSNLQCYRAVQPRIIFLTRKILPSIDKDNVPTTQQSMVVYQFVCYCDCLFGIRWLFDSMTVTRSLHSLRSYIFYIICNGVRYFHSLTNKYMN